MSFPFKDSLLVDFSTNFNDRIVASPGTYSLSALQASTYTGYHTPFITAYNALVAARESGTRSRSLAAAKDACKADLLAYGRQLYAQVQSSSSVPNAAKIELGVRVRSAPSRQPIPGFAPRLTVESVDGTVVNIRLSDPANPSRKRIPAGVNGAVVMSYVGETAPTNPTAYSFQGSVSRTTMVATFPETLAPGTKVWLTACWFNERKQPGPACAPVAAIINYGGSMPMAA
jgi:hypothetical protein